MPTEKYLLSLDALYADAPLMRQLQEERISFLIGIKEGYVSLQVERLSAQGALAEISWQTSSRVCAVRFTNGLPFSGQNPELVVNYIEYLEVEPTTAELLYFHSWITDLTVNEQNAHEMVAGGVSN